MNLDHYKSLLAKYVSFKTVSTDPSFKPEIEKCVTWLNELFTKNGFKVEIWRGKKSNPVVFAQFDSQKSETVLVYGHYDVQPADINDGWKSNPFLLKEQGGRLIARGIIDNKGQNLIHIVTVLKLIQEKKLAYNVKFVLEGDEETGAGELDSYIALPKFQRKLRADHVLISDGEVVGNHPVIEVSLRGGFNLTLTYKTAETNLHSGIYGSAIPNAAHELTRFLAGLYSFENKVTIPGFYDGVDPISKEQLKNSNKLVELAPDFLAGTGVKALKTEKGVNFYTQTGLRPAIQVTGIKSGYISNGYANIVPNMAEARINFRLVTSQSPNRILEHFKKYVAKTTPNYVNFKISVGGIHWPVKLDNTSEMTQHIKRLLVKSHGKEVLHRHVGGAIPVVLSFQDILKANVILVPLVNADCNMHGVGENFKIDLLNKGLDFSRQFFEKM